MLAGGGEQIERAGEEENADEKAPPGERLEGLSLGQDEEHDGVDEMIKGGFFPNVHGTVLDEDGFHSMCAECAEHHGEEPHEGGDAGGEGLCHFKFFYGK